MLPLSHTAGVGTFLLVSIAILIVMGSVLEGAATQIGTDSLQLGIVLVASMEIGLFVPPIGLGLLLVIAFVPLIAHHITASPV